MAHRVGDRHMQGVAFDREVERVSGDVARGFQPSRERELPGLARVRAGQQPMLDLGGERQADRALAPFEEVGEAAVRDDDVRERVRGQCDVRQRLLVGKLRKAQLQNADGLPAVGHRREQTDTVSIGLDLERLAGQRAAMRASHQGDALRRLAPLGSAGRRAAGVAQSNERLPAEVRDEKGNLRGAERVREALGEHIGRRDRRCVLHGCQQPHQIQSRVLIPGHRLQRRRRSAENSWAAVDPGGSVPEIGVGWPRSGLA